MRKHTTIDLDTDLVRAAARALGTTRTTDTVHAALSEVIRMRQRLRLLDYVPDLTLEQLEAMRAPRFTWREPEEPPVGERPTRR